MLFKIFYLMLGRRLGNRPQGLFCLFRGYDFSSLERSFADLRFSSSFHIGRICLSLFVIGLLFLANVGSRFKPTVAVRHVLIETEAVDFLIFKAEKTHKNC